MAKTPRPWTVREHSPLTKIDENIWAIEDHMPNKIHRRMSIFKRTDGDLVFFNAIPVDDTTLAEIRAIGTPRYLILGHHQHMFDAHAFQQKLGLKVYGPEATQTQLKQRVEVQGSLADLPKDPTIDFFSMPGSKFGEATAIVKSGDRVSIFTSDVLQNNNPATTPFMFRLIGFAGGPKIAPIYKMLFAKDKPAIKKEILRWADMPGLKRLVPFHGDIVEAGVADKLRASVANL